MMLGLEAVSQGWSRRIESKVLFMALVQIGS